MKYPIGHVGCFAVLVTSAMLSTPVLAQDVDVDADAAASGLGQTIHFESPDPFTVDDEEIEQVSWTGDGSCDDALAYCSCGGSACQACGDRPTRNWFATYESVLVQPVQSNSTGVIVQTDEGYSHVAFPWEISHSPRISFGSHATGGQLGWRLRYWQFRHTEAFDASDDNGLIPIGTEAVAGYLSEDGDITTGLAFIQEGRFASGIRTDVIDWELQRSVTNRFNVFAGLRYAKVAQGYSAITDQGNIAANSEFRGIGPTVAMRFDQPVLNRKVSLFTDLRGSLLMGGRDFHVRDDVNDITQSIGVLRPSSGDDHIDALVNNAELQLGVLVQPSDWLSWQVALECQYFGNVGGPNPTGVFTGPDSGLAGDGPSDDSLGFVGLSAGLGLRY